MAAEGRRNCNGERRSAAAAAVRSCCGLLGPSAVWFILLVGCENPPESRTPAAQADDRAPSFRNVEAPTKYVGDFSCVTCHAAEASAYRRHAMATSFHRWAPNVRVETLMDTVLRHASTGFEYTVTEENGRLYQVERLVGPQGKRLHELRKRMDYVMGSGAVARTYFTEENGRLFQLPLTWYRQHGWDFSPGYEINNARFDRVMPDRCIACHSSYPEAIPFLEGKYAQLRPGIGCERCHGPGALHVAERRVAVERDTSFDNSIVNPARLPLERRLDVCEQCHVHTAVTVLREGKSDFSYVPSQPLRDQVAFFKVAGGIDIVSHADRLRQSACFIATRTTPRPLECATCHDPHTAPDSLARNQSCGSCHSSISLKQSLGRSPARAAHASGADCATCHMPRVRERGVPHGTFTEHWIRVPTAQEATSNRRRAERPIEPYYDRDKSGADAEVYQGIGEVIYATQADDAGALASAAAVLERALAKATTRDDAHFFLGVAYEQLGRTAAAIRVLEQSVRGDSSHPDRLRALAQAYERAGRSPDTIGSLYRRALAMQPALAWIRADYGDFLRVQGRHAEAEKAYRDALAEQPSLAVARFNLGTLLIESDRLPEARVAFREAVNRDPLLAEGLSRVLEMRTRGNAVTAVRGVDSPLPGAPVRARNPRAVQMTITTTPRAGVAFLNTPPGVVIQVLRPNGAVIRALPTGAGGSLSWDLLTETGTPIAGGIYRARVHGRDPVGGPLPAQPLYFSVVRVGG